MKTTTWTLGTFGLGMALLLSACNDGGGGGATAVATQPGIPDDGGATSVTNPPSSPPPVVSRNYTTDVMLFVGDGTWGTEIGSLETILSQHGASYKEINSAQLDAMSVDDMAQYGLMIFPGGAGGTEAGSVSSTTHANIREAVQQRGVSYLGFCAGTFIAEAPAPAAGRDVSYGFGVVDGPILDYYYLENQGTDIQMVEHSFADGSTRNILWYGGPVTPDITGGVIAKYPTGEPAMSEMWSGNGFVILSGTHPTANPSIISGLGLTPDGDNTDIAWNLINGALHQQPLPAF